MTEKLLDPKKVFKEKRSIKGELLKALENNTPIGATELSRLVGISIYRVRKYCKTHDIDLDNYSKEALEKTKKAKTVKAPLSHADKKRAKRARKIVLDTPESSKIHLSPVQSNKISLD